MGSSVTLSCQVEGSATAIPLYDIEWYKYSGPGRNGTLSKIKSEESVVKSIWPLTELCERDEGTYVCKIHRSVLRYSASKLINIYVKGKP